ncbi:uncharacterized protein LOC144133445 [Amblyomma americanum]
MKITCPLLLTVGVLVVGATTGAAEKPKILIGKKVGVPKSQFHNYQHIADELARLMSRGRQSLLVVTSIIEVKVKIVAGSFIWIKILVTESDCRPGTRQSECKILLCAPSYTCKAKIFEDWTQTKFLSKHCNFHEDVKGQRQRC